MGISLPHDRNKKTMFLAIGASVIAGAATMFIPTSVLEGITGATGLSEIIPATAAPLGDKARAMIAFGAGAVTLAVMALWLFGRDEADDSDYSFPAEQKTTQEDSGMIDSNKLTAIKDRIVNFNLPKMPWTKADNDVRDLEDLPRVRMADQHPDAPPRHPLSVTSEMPSEKPSRAQPLGKAASEPEIQRDPAPQPAAPQPDMPQANIPEAAIPQDTAPKVTIPAPATRAPDSMPEQPVSESRGPATPQPIEPEAPKISSPQLGDMIGQLEAAMENRQQQLAQLEMVSNQLKADKQVAAQMAADDRPAIAKGIATAAKSPSQMRPVLEEVKPAVTQDAEVDSALNAALETLQRMNAQSR